MNKKLIITEEQYRNLKFFILETTFSDMADKIIKKDDVITITSNNKKLNFKVIDNFSGQIYMDNIDKDNEYFGKRVFLNKLSFNNNNLQIQVAKDDEQKNEEPPKGSTWQKMTLKNIEQIDVSRGGEIIDGTNFDVKSEELKNGFIELLSTLNEGESLKLETEGEIGDIILDVLSKSSGFIHFEISEETKDALGNPNISTVDISTNKDMVEVDENGLLSISVITYESKDGSMDKKEEKIKNIKDFSSLNTEENPEDNNVETEEEPEDNEDDFDAKEIFNILSNDTELKNAFYKRPTFWRSFVAELKGEKPKTTGYTYVQNLLRNYMDDSTKKKLGKNFLKQGKISFRPLEDIKLRWVEKGKNKLEEFDVNDFISVNWKRSEPMGGAEYGTLLRNNTIDVLVKQKSDKPNTYICDIYRRFPVTTVDAEGDKTTKIKRSEPAEDITVEFLKSPVNSPGYSADKDVEEN
jgi:hypothetical protein